MYLSKETNLENNYNSTVWHLAVQYIKSEHFWSQVIDKELYKIWDKFYLEDFTKSFRKKYPKFVEIVQKYLDELFVNSHVIRGNVATCEAIC